MAADPTPNYPTVTPYLLYEKGAAAVEWLESVFGFKPRMRMDMPDGSLGHAEMELEGGLIMLGEPGGDYQSPQRHGRVGVLVHVYVNDVDAHFQRARDAGAKILSEPEDQPYGNRRYEVEDLEGHQWTFAQHVRDVPPERGGGEAGG